MKLAGLLEQHRNHVTAPGALAKSLGDGYLCQKNRFYWRARAQALECGFKFSTEQDSASLALPLSQLESILESKTIPYFDNVNVLEWIEKKIPKQTLWNELVDNIKGNLIFHEACHAFAHTKLEGVDPMLGMLLGESYANTYELLAIMDADDQTHRIFLQLNCYSFVIDDRVHLLNTAKEIGLPALTRFMLLSYLHANYLQDTVDFDRVCELALDKPAESKTLKSLRQLSKIAFRLNPRFREVTTPFFFKLYGIPAKFDTDFLSVIENSEKARDFLKIV